MRWSLAELLFELEQDKARAILFVEGTRDLGFWRELFPLNDRGNVVIYPISVVECPSIEGGERGRLIWCAEEFTHHPEHQVLFFGDADSDEILMRCLPQNVILTDGRDLESYGISDECFDRIAMTGLGLAESKSKQLFACIETVARPLGLVRIAVARLQSSNTDGTPKLPFQKTLSRGVSRFVNGSKTSAQFDLNRFLQNLLQNAEISLKNLEGMVQLFHVERSNQSKLSHEKVVHGKDLVLILSWFFNVNEEYAESMLFLSIDYESLKNKENIGKVLSWAYAVK